MRKILLLVLALVPLWAAENGVIRVPLRSRVETFKGSGEWQEVSFARNFPIQQTAIVICDMWDNHWCTGAAKRVGLLAQKMAPFLDQARDRGIQIIHSPSEVMAFYAEAPQRKMMLSLAKIEPPPNLSLADPPLPIDDSAGGCETGDRFYKAWTRQIATLRIGPNDVISDRGPEVYALLRQRGIHNLLMMGVHTNMCVLNRTFAIKQMTKWGMHCVLVRDLTDAMYDPQARPYVSHEQGTELVIQHIEKYWCPTALSRDIGKALTTTPK